MGRPAYYGSVNAPGKFRDVMRCFPQGVAVVSIDAGGQRLGLTVSALVSLSLEPPLVGVAVSRQAALHELLREAGGFGVSLLAAGQEALAEHFARGVPTIAMWEGIETLDLVGPPLLAGAVGWLVCTVRDEVDAGTHTLFAGVVDDARQGAPGPSLARVRGAWVEV